MFRGSRLSVRRVGEALERGEKAETIREDYPYLTGERAGGRRRTVRWRRIYMTVRAHRAARYGQVGCPWKPLPYQKSPA